MSKQAIRKLTVAAIFTCSLGTAHAFAKLEVNGRADTNADFTSDSFLQDSEIGDPLGRTIISVSDSNSVFSYFALSDFSTPKMQIKGTWNNGATPLGNGESAILAAKPSIRETFTVDVPIPTDYRVTA